MLTHQKSSAVFFLINFYFIYYKSCRIAGPRDPQADGALVKKVHQVTSKYSNKEHVYQFGKYFLCGTL